MLGCSVRVCYQAGTQQHGDANLRIYDDLTDKATVYSL